MEDRSLLEAAALAAGIRLEWDGPPKDWTPMYYKGKTYHAWDPLEDDGEAFRLGVKLHILGASDALTFAAMEMGDPCAAARRTIVLAAAEQWRKRRA